MMNSMIIYSLEAFCFCLTKKKKLCQNYELQKTIYTKNIYWNKKENITYICPNDLSSHERNMAQQQWHHQ